MRILADTHIALWAISQPSRLSAKARALLENRENECWVSSASAWELAIKARLGRHRLTYPLAWLEAALEESGFLSLPVTIGHALAIEAIDVPHADPFDRLLLAQCHVETLRLLTADRQLSGLPVAIAA